MWILYEDVWSPCGAPILSFPLGYRNLHDKLLPFRFVAWCHPMSCILKAGSPPLPFQCFRTILGNLKQSAGRITFQELHLPEDIQKQYFGMLQMFPLFQIEQCGGGKLALDLSIPPALPFRNLAQRHSPEKTENWARLPVLFSERLNYLILFPTNTTSMSGQRPALLTKTIDSFSS